MIWVRFQLLPTLSWSVWATDTPACSLWHSTDKLTVWTNHFLSLLFPFYQFYCCSTLGVKCPVQYVTDPFTNGHLDGETLFSRRIHGKCFRSYWLIRCISVALQSMRLSPDIVQSMEIWTKMQLEQMKHTVILCKMIFIPPSRGRFFPH